MRFQRVAANVQTSFDRGNAVIDDETDWDLPQSHPDHFSEANRRIGDSRPDPETEEIEKNDREHKREHRQYCDADKIKGFHDGESTPIFPSREVFSARFYSFRSTQLHGIDPILARAYVADDHQLVARHGQFIFTQKPFRDLNRGIWV